MGDCAIRALGAAHRDWARRLIGQRWNSTRIVSRGRVHDADHLPGFVGIYDDRPAGLLMYAIEGDQCEVVTLDSLLPGRGIGSALINAAKSAAASAGCRRVWLITTNDNTEALRFYQKRGFELVCIRRHAVREARRLKPEIPLIGCHGIPLRDEIELEIRLGAQIS